MFINLIHNSTLLITLSLLYWIIRIYKPSSKLLYNSLQGVWFGVVAILAMMMPYNYAEGLLYDGRSVVLLLAGYFGGGFTLIISILISALYRLSLGGIGIWAGTLSIICSGVVGLLFREYTRRKNKSPKFFHFIIIGVVAHILVLISQLLMSFAISIPIIKMLSPIFLVMFPLTFAIISIFIQYFDNYIDHELKNRELLFWLKEIENAGRVGSYSYNYNNQCIDGTDVYNRILGKSPKTVNTYDDWQLLICEDDQAKTISYFESIIEHKQLEFECTYRINKGLKDEDCWILERGKIDYQSDGSPDKRFGTIIDITEIKSFEQQLAESESRFKNAILKSPIPISVHDEDGKIINLSDGWTNYSGYSLDDIPSIHTWVQKAFPDTAREIEEYITSVSGQKQTMHHGDFRVYAKSGEIRVWNFYSTLLDGRFNGKRLILTIAPDITKRIEAINRLEESENAYRDLFEKHTAVKFLINPNTFRILKANLASQYFYGYTIEELESMNFGKLNTINNEELRKLFEDNNQQETISFEIEQKRKNNGNCFVEVFFNALTVKGEKVLHLIIHDSTEKRKNLKELEIAKDRAEESDRLKTSFLTNMSHEIRTPLNAIMGFSSLLPDTTDEDDIRNYAQIVVTNSEYLVSLIDDIMLYSKLQSRLMNVEITKFKLMQLFNEIAATFEVNKRNNAVQFNMLTNFDPELEIRSDYNKLKQLLFNFVSNAFKYTEVGEITLGVNFDDDHLVFYVSDSGIGLPKGESKKIFDRFYRGSNVPIGSIGGTGLGLSIVVELSNLLGGQVWAENNHGKGATFYFSTKLKNS